MRKHYLIFDITEWQTSTVRQGEVIVTLGHHPRDQRRFTVKIPQDIKPKDLPKALRCIIADRAQQAGIDSCLFRVGACTLDSLLPYKLHISIYTDLPLHVQFNIHAHPS